MTALTPEQLARIRRQSGDITVPYDEADADIQAIYDDTALGNSSLDATTYYVIRDRMTLAATQMDTLSDSGTGMSRSISQKFANLRKLLDLWGGIAGIAITPALPALVVGTLSLGIDATCADLEADPAPDWLTW